MRKNEINKILEAIFKEVETHDSLFVNASVDNGSMGVALLYFYYHSYNDKYEYLERGVDMIQKSIESLSTVSKEKYYEPSYKGDNIINVISSFGKGLLFVENKFNLDFDFHSYYNQLGDVLSASLEKQLQLGNFDYFSGALAPGHYFINSYYYRKDEHSKKMLIKIFNKLKLFAIKDLNEEVYWRSYAYNYTVYLGISHGSAMIINFICKLFDLKILYSQEDKNFLKSAMNFIVRKKRKDGDRGYFPNVYYKDKFDTNETQIGMCYGDLGILFVLCNAASILGNSYLNADIHNMLYSYLEKPLDMKRTYDAGILYGASGIYWMFREMNERGILNSCSTTARFWYDQIFSFRDQNRRHYAGFLDAYKGMENEPNKSSMYSFLWGISGIAITLMAGQNRELPKINELTLLGI